MKKTEQLYNDKVKVIRKALLGWVIVWLNIFSLFVFFGPHVFKGLVVVAILYDLLLHIGAAHKNPYHRKWGWVFYPVIFQRGEDVSHFDLRYHLFWIPYWATVLFIILQII